MCFSAPVSFVASAGLLGVGGVALAKAKRKYRYIAVIPFMFGLQQLFEGLQWVSHGASLLYAYLFLFFAFIVWPTYIPFALYKIEKNKKRKSILVTLLSMGAFASLYMIILLINEPLALSVSGESIVYAVHVPTYQMLLGVIYYVAIIAGSMFVAKDRLVNIFGIILSSSAVIAWVFFNFAFVSVWCFMAGILSLLVYYFIYKRS